MLDTKGPEIRTGPVNRGGGKIQYVKDTIVKVTTDYEAENDETTIACSYKSLPKSVKVGSNILCADGSLTLEVTEILEDGVNARCVNDALIGPRKNMNLPGCIVDLPTLTEKDIYDIENFAIKNCDKIAASFVRKGSDIDAIREILGPKGAHIRIIAKIENQEGMENYMDIVRKADGIMVARGDLGMEIPPEKVFLAQKWMIDIANLAGKPVITATQMLESMTGKPVPTRAEASDVANAVIDGSDAVMLSGETAGGQFPIESCEVMSKICFEAERLINFEKLHKLMVEKIKPESPADIIASEATQTAMDIHAKIIICFSETGRMARRLAAYRPAQRIIVAADNYNVVKSCNASRGLIGFKIPTFLGREMLLQQIIQECKKRGFCIKGDTIVAVYGS
jgi:pyruvate kinase